MTTPRIYGTPTAKAAAVIRSRDDLVSAIRTNDDAALMGLAPDTKAGGNGGTPFGFFDFSAGIQLNQFAGYASYLAACTKRVWAVSRANDIIANIVISTDMKMQSRDKAARANRRKVPRVDPELIRLLANPNPYDTISEMLYLWVCHMKITGNVFWFKDEMNGYGQPKNIYWLNPKNIIIVPDPKTRIKHYIYRVNGTDIIFYPEEIIHFKRPHADNSLWGLGDIEQGESLYDDFINRALYNTRLMANGAMPSSVLVKEDFEGDQNEWEKTKAKFQETYGGARNAGKVAWMNGKWSLLQMGITAQQMQEMEKAKVNVEHIFLNAGVPLSVAGFGAANYACLPAGEMVSTPNGPVGIEKLKSGDEILQFDASIGFVKQTVDAIITQPPAPVFEIVTPNRRLRASDNHPVLIAVPADGVGAGPKKSVERSWSLVWKKAADIMPGDFVVTMEEAPDHGMPWPEQICGESDLDTAYLMGAYLGDGSGIGAKRPVMSIAAHEKELGWQAEIARCMEQLYRKFPKYKHNHSRKEHGNATINTTQVKAHGADVCRRLVEAGFGGTSHTKKIPPFVWSLKKELKLALLAGLVDADGTVAKDRGAICLASCNLGLMTDARDLALSCGVPVSNISTDSQNTNFGQATYHRFTMGYAEHNALLKLRHPKKAGLIHFAVEHRKWKRLSSVKIRFGRTHQKLGRPQYKGLKLPQSAGISEVSAVNFLGVMPVFDLATYGTHTFVASGVVTHNTARQDRINMRSDTCLPMVNLFCDAINSPRGLVPAFHEDLELGFALAGLIDVEQVTKEYEPLVRYGAMSPNDFNEIVGRPRVDNPLLDQYYVDANRMPIEMAGLADVPPVAPAAKPKPALPPAA